jgi:hypothetical protein
MNAWYGYRKHRTECNNTRAPASSGGSVAPTNPQSPQNDDDAVGPGGCWSGTLQDTVDASVCVQSKYDRVWFQCQNGKWYRGVSGSTGPYGACTAQHPL